MRLDVLVQNSSARCYNLEATREGAISLYLVNRCKTMDATKALDTFLSEGRVECDQQREASDEKKKA